MSFTPRTDSLTGHVQPTKQTTPGTSEKKKALFKKNLTIMIKHTGQKNEIWFSQI